MGYHSCFFFQAEDGIRDGHVTGVQTCALPISFDVASALEERTGAPVRIGNDVKLAGLGEARVGAGRAASSMLLVWLGRRVSTSVVMDGIVLQGAHGLAGEITAEIGRASCRGREWGAGVVGRVRSTRWGVATRAQ